MRRGKRILAAAMSAALCLTGVGMQTMSAQAAKIKLNKAKLQLQVGQTYTLKLKGAPTTATVTWKTSKKKVATVSKKGKVKAIKAGKADITAVYGKKKYVCKVTVKKKASKTTTEAPAATSAAPAASAVPSAAPGAQAPVSPAPGAQDPAQQGTTDPGSAATQDPGSVATQDPGSAATQDPGSAATQDPGSEVTNEPAGETNTPDETPAAVDTKPVEFSSAAMKPESSFAPEGLAEKISVTAEKAYVGTAGDGSVLSGHVLLTVTNGNKDSWVDDTDVSCIFRDKSGKVIGEDSFSLYLLKPGEERKYAADVEGDVTKIDIAQSSANVTAESEDEFGKYEDAADQITASTAFDTSVGTVELTLANATEQEVKASYVCYMYKGKNIVDVISGSVDVEPEDTDTEYIDIPSINNSDGSTEYLADGCDVEVIGHYFVQQVQEEELAKNISVTIDDAKNVPGYVRVKVTNGNDSWVTAVDIDATFYDAEGGVLETSKREIGTMAPKEELAVLLELGEDTKTAMVNSETGKLFAEPTYDIAATAQTEQDVYAKADAKTVTVTEQLDDNDYTVTVTNTSDKNVEVSLVIYGYHDEEGVNGTKIEKAGYEIVSVPAGGSQDIFFTGATLTQYDSDGQETTPYVNFNRLDYDVTVHTVETVALAQ